MLEPLSDFVRQSIASGNVQGAIEHVVGLLAAQATIEGFEKKLGEKILDKGLKDLQVVGSAVLKRLPWTAAERQQKLAAAQEVAGVQEIEAEVRSVLNDPQVAAEIRSLSEKLLENAAPRGTQDIRQGDGFQFNAPVNNPIFGGTHYHSGTSNPD